MSQSNLFRGWGGAALSCGITDRNRSGRHSVCCSSIGADGHLYYPPPPHPPTPNSITSITTMELQLTVKTTFRLIHVSRESGGVWGGGNEQMTMMKMRWTSDTDAELQDRGVMEDAAGGGQEHHLCCVGGQTGSETVETDCVHQQLLSVCQGIVGPVVHKVSVKQHVGHCRVISLLLFLSSSSPPPLPPLTSSSLPPQKN